MPELSTQPDYFGNDRTEMQAFLPSSARVILDVGCGAGVFGAALKVARATAGVDLEVWGLERDPAAAELAAGRLDKVLCGDVEAVTAQLPTAHFDCLVLNDILEHLAQPADVLRALRAHLKPGGHVVASIPNVRYFNNVVNLAVHGRWDYTDEGILDRTHLRFFTRGSMVDLLEDTGYAVRSVTGINPTGSAKFKLANLLTLGRWADMRYLQFAVVAVVGDSEEG